MENETWEEEYRKRAEDRVKASETAQARIDALIARAGGPMMIVKNNEQYSASARMAEIDKRARMMAHKLNSPKYECTISIMGDEIIAQDAKIRDMANIIDRLEAALYNTLNERDQLLDDLQEAATKNGFFGACTYCAWEKSTLYDDPRKTCMECLANSKHPNFDWRGVPEVKDDDA